MSDDLPNPTDPKSDGQGLPVELKAAWLLTNFITAIRRLPAGERVAKLKEAERRLYEIRRYEQERPAPANPPDGKRDLKLPYD